MKTKLIVPAVLLAALLSSCSTLHYHYSEARIAEASTDVFVVPPTVKVDVNPVGFVDTWVFDHKDLKALLSPGITADILTQRLKTAATNKSLQKHQGDILVAPLFDIVSENDGHRYIVTIRSHIGNFTDWNMNTEDYLQIQKSYYAPEQGIGVYTR